MSLDCVLSICVAFCFGNLYIDDHVGFWMNHPGVLQCFIEAVLNTILLPDSVLCARTNIS